MPLYLGGLVFFIGGLLIGLFIEKFGLITTILYNLSDALKDNEYFIFIPLSLFGIALLIAVIISKLVLVKFGIHSLIN